MAVSGISGGSPAGGATVGSTIQGYPITELQLIEQRAINAVLLSGLAEGGEFDPLDVLRNDQAFELNLPQPVTGTGR